MIQLPTANVPAQSRNPKKLLIWGQIKTGKTDLLTKLDGNLILDLQGSASFFGGMYLDIREIAKNQNITLFQAYMEVIKSLKIATKEKGAPLYKYITIDCLTDLEEIAKDYALIIYKESEIGKNFKGTDIFSLPNGAGEHPFRLAMDKLYSLLEGLYSECLILVGHVKSASISKNGTEITVRDLQLRGKSKSVIAGDMDAVGYLYRERGKPVNMLSFIGDERDIATGSRCEHLSNKEFVISEMTEKGLVTHWNKVFLP